MDGFVGGLAVGILVGILIGPLIRSWVLWHELAGIRRGAGLADGILDRMDRDDIDTADDRDGYTDGRR